MKLINLIAILISGLLITDHLFAEKAAVDYIKLKQIDGRHWLVDSDGQPFFAHGVTHVGHSGSREKSADVSQACKDLGFNSYGYGCPDKLKSDMPYIESANHLVPISTYRSDGSFHFVDIFDPKVQVGLEAKIKSLCIQNRENTNLIGYCWTDLAAWPLKNSTDKNWVDFTRELPDGAPGKKVYEKFLATWKGDDPTKRDTEFLRLIAREYFRVLGEANRKFDPHHLIFGDRLSFPTLDKVVLEEMLPYVDAIAIQPHYRPGFPKAKFEEIHQLTGKPIVICDFAIRFKDGDKDIRGYKPMETSEAAGAAYSAYLRDAMKTPYIIGAFWCNLMDSKPGFKKSGVKQGLFGEGLAPRPDLHDSVRDLNKHRDKNTPKN